MPPTRRRLTRKRSLTRRRRESRQRKMKRLKRRSPGNLSSHSLNQRKKRVRRTNYRRKRQLILFLIMTEIQLVIKLLLKRAKISSNLQRVRQSSRIISATGLTTKMKTSTRTHILELSPQRNN